MRVSIKNLGALKNAEVEVGDLTIIAGENSTGKTNLVYTIWDVIRQTEKYFTYAHNQSHKQELKECVSNEIKNNDETNVNIPLTLLKKDKFESVFKIQPKEKKVKELISDLLVNDLHDSFNLNVENTNVQLELFNMIGVGISEEIEFSDSSYITSINSDVTYNIKVPFFVYPKLDNDTIKYEITHEKIQLDFDNKNYSPNEIQEIESEIYDSFSNPVDFIDHDDYVDMIYNSICKSLENTLYNTNNIEIATSERAGIISFLPENEQKLRETSIRNQGQLPSRFVYTLPVINNIGFIKDLPNIIDQRIKDAKSKNNEELQENIKLQPIYQEIEKMIGGYLTMNQMGEIRFNKDDKTEDERSLKFNNLSSSIKHLTMIYFQLKYSEIFANIDKNTYYVIDEPEAFLHPMNQNKMARIITMLVNFGVKVIITTHSEYLIRELNALIALGSNDIQPKNYRGFSVLNDVTENMSLNVKKKDVNIYTLNLNGMTEPQDINSKGMDFNAFDSALESQANIFNAVRELATKAKKD